MERLVQADGRHQSVANLGRQKCQTGMQMCCRRRSAVSLSAENRDTNTPLSYWKSSDNSCGLVRFTRHNILVSNGAVTCDFVCLVSVIGNVDGALL